MGRYLAPGGVVVETSERAARSVGYQSAEQPAEEKKAPTKRAAKSEK